MQALGTVIAAAHERSYGRSHEAAAGREVPAGRQWVDPALQISGQTDGIGPER